MNDDFWKESVTRNWHYFLDSFWKTKNQRCERSMFCVFMKIVILGWYEGLYLGELIVVATVKKLWLFFEYLNDTTCLILFRIFSYFYLKKCECVDLTLESKLYTDLHTPKYKKKDKLKRIRKERKKI